MWVAFILLMARNVSFNRGFTKDVLFGTDAQSFKKRHGKFNLEIVEQKDDEFKPFETIKSK